MIKMKLNPTSIELPEAVRGAMVKLLNQQLVDMIDLGVQAKQAHWNVKGPNFISLHELFDRVAVESQGFGDELAERVVQLGGVALGTIQCISADSRLAPYPPGILPSADHITALCHAVTKVGTTIRLAI